MTLTISMTSPSADLKDSPISRAIVKLAATVAGKSRAGLIPTSPSLDVMFMLPGKLDKPAFSGMRMGGYDADNQTLFFEKAVPEHILHSHQSPEYVAMVMQDVVANAHDFFRDLELMRDAAPSFDEMQWQRLINQISDAVKEPEEA